MVATVRFALKAATMGHVPGRHRSLVVGALLMLVVVFGAGSLAACSGPSPIRRTADTALSTTSATVVANDFHPAERNLSDCGPAAERPGCGSESKGGWRMALVLVALLAGICVIAGRIIVAARRRGRLLNQPTTDWVTTAPRDPA